MWDLSKREGAKGRGSWDRIEVFKQSPGGVSGAKPPEAPRFLGCLKPFFELLQLYLTYYNVNE